MEFTPFLLNDWLSRYHFGEKAIEFDLASSTGPGWTFRQLLDLMDPDQKSRLQGSELGYTPGPGTAALREAIAGMQGVDPAEVQVTTGASEALLLLFFRAARPGANVVVPSPGYPAFTEIPRALGIEIRSYSLRREDHYRIDLDEIRRQTDGQTALVVVNSPQNPTGATLSDDDLRALDEFAGERGVQLVVDEVYHPIYHDRETDSAATLPHTTVIGDFSKAFCLPGLRTGWMVDHDPARRKEYVQARSYFTVCNTVVGEALAVAAVRHREKIFAEVRRVTNANLTLLDKLFQEFPNVIDWVRPRGGMTAFPWLVAGGDARPFCEAAAERGVLLAPGDCFGMPAHFRLGFATAGDNFPAALERLTEFITRYPRQAARAG